MELVKKAYEFAKVAHEGVYRKGTGEPYWQHPARVAAVLDALDFPDIAIAAAFLHDVVEDTAVPIEEIVAEFDIDVALLVAMVTKPVMDKSKTSRAERNAAYRQQLALSSYLGASIKLSDILDNSRNVAEVDPEFASIYIPELRENVEVLGHGNPVLLVKVKQQLGM